MTSPVGSSLGELCRKRTKAARGKPELTEILLGGNNSNRNNKTWKAKCCYFIT